MPLPLVDKQNKGQIFYRQGKYHEALGIFSSVGDVPLCIFLICSD